MKIKHTLASIKDKKCTILNSQLYKYIDKDIIEIIINYKLENDLLYGIKFHKSRNGKTWYADSRFPQQLQMPEISKPVIHNIHSITIIK